jgi:ribosomal protein S18 acetylase RimI-like enzyme
MLLTNTAQISHDSLYSGLGSLQVLFDASRITELRDEHKDETLKFLAQRPVHTVVMTSFIVDNGLESESNRGRFYGYRGNSGSLEGVALIGHTTLVEAHTDEALRALAMTAHQSETPIHMIMSSGDSADQFWRYLAGPVKEPRLRCTELLFEVSFPYPVPDCEWDIRPARQEELLDVAEAQAAVAFMECGVDPMERDREGFLKRVTKRIEQDRVFVVYEGDKLVFKADIIAQTDDVIYLEGVYVSPEYRGRGVGSSCLAKLTLGLLREAQNLCLLSNISFVDAHMSYLRAGYRNTDSCVTLFV